MSNIRHRVHRCGIFAVFSTVYIFAVLPEGKGHLRTHICWIIGNRNIQHDYRQNVLWTCCNMLRPLVASQRARPIMFVNISCCPKKKTCAVFYSTFRVIVRGVRRGPHPLNAQCHLHLLCFCCQLDCLRSTKVGMTQIPLGNSNSIELHHIYEVLQWTNVPCSRVLVWSQ